MWCALAVNSKSAQELAYSPPPLRNANTDVPVFRDSSVGTSQSALARTHTAEPCVTDGGGQVCVRFRRVAEFRWEIVPSITKASMSKSSKSRSVNFLFLSHEFPDSKSLQLCDKQGKPPWNMDSKSEPPIGPIAFHTFSPASTAMYISVPFSSLITQPNQQNLTSEAERSDLDARGEINGHFYGVIVADNSTPMMRAPILRQLLLLWEAREDREAFMTFARRCLNVVNTSAASGILKAFKSTARPPENASGTSTFGGIEPALLWSQRCGRQGGWKNLEIALRGKRKGSILGRSRHDDQRGGDGDSDTGQIEEAEILMRRRLALYA